MKRHALGASKDGVPCVLNAAALLTSQRGGEERLRLKTAETGFILSMQNQIVKLSDWDFADQTANAVLQQINRQKSARNLVVVKLDQVAREGIFLDPKKGIQNLATLGDCDCHDFNFAGNNPRKTFKPCMHIYRLAMEFGLIEAKYQDRKTREAEVHERTLAETMRLKSLPSDREAWGRWNAEVHASGIQKNRQYSAYSIKFEEPGAIVREGDAWRIHDYAVTLRRCGCPDFLERRLPCKHIYAAALESDILLPLTHGEYTAAKAQNLERVFEF